MTIAEAKIMENPGKRHFEADLTTGDIRVHEPQYIKVSFRRVAAPPPMARPHIDVTEQGLLYNDGLDPLDPANHSATHHENVTQGPPMAGGATSLPVPATNGEFTQDRSVNLRQHMAAPAPHQVVVTPKAPTTNNPAALTSGPALKAKDQVLDQQKIDLAGQQQSDAAKAARITQQKQVGGGSQQNKAYTDAQERIQTRMQLRHAHPLHKSAWDDEEIQGEFCPSCGSTSDVFYRPDRERGEGNNNRGCDNCGFNWSVYDDGPLGPDSMVQHYARHRAEEEHDFFETPHRHPAHQACLGCVDRDMDSAHPDDLIHQPHSRDMRKHQYQPAEDLPPGARLAAELRRGPDDGGWDEDEYERSDPKHYGPPRGDHAQLVAGGIGLSYTPAGAYGYYHTTSPDGKVHHSIEWDAHEGDYRVSSTDNPRDYDNTEWTTTHANSPQDVAEAIRKHEVHFRGGGVGEPGGKAWWKTNTPQGTKNNTMDFVPSTEGLEQAARGSSQADRAVYGSRMFSLARFIEMYRTGAMSDEELERITRQNEEARRWLDEEAERAGSGYHHEREFYQQNPGLRNFEEQTHYENPEIREHPEAQTARGRTQPHQPVASDQEYSHVFSIPEMYNHDVPIELHINHEGWENTDRLGMRPHYRFQWVHNGTPVHQGEAWGPVAGAADMHDMARSISNFASYDADRLDDDPEAEDEENRDLREHVGTPYHDFLEREGERLGLAGMDRDEHPDGGYPGDGPRLIREHHVASAFSERYTAQAPSDDHSTEETC